MTPAPLSRFLGHPSQPIYRVAEIRAIEEAYASRHDASLMERAGAAATHDALALIRASRLPPLVVCGPGNNGGDGLVLARLLKNRGMNPVVVFTGTADKLSADARLALQAWLDAGGEVLGEIPTRRQFSLAVDALFGTGLQRPITDARAALIEQINALACPILALDVPSGLDADTGRVLGHAVRAHHTSTFIALKPGLLTLDGTDHCGEISVHDLEVAPESLVPTQGRIVEPILFASLLKPRPKNSHKGMMGSVGIVGGAPGMVGAALLAGAAALKLGAGRVYVGLIDERAPAVDAQQPELMLRSPRELIASDLATTLAIGPGLGKSGTALDLLKQCVGADSALVLDADALNLVAAHPVLAGRVAKRGAPTLVTPHPAEAARLLDCDTRQIQSDRVAAALGLTRKLNAHVVLKGNGSVLAAPDGRWFINTSGNPGMASAGMGDVLTGMAAALLAQGWAAEPALLGAVHLHGRAADRLVADGVGPVGLAAGELVDAARRLFNDWLCQGASRRG